MTQNNYKRIVNREDVKLDSLQRDHLRKHYFLDNTFNIILFLMSAFAAFGVIGTLYSYFYDQERFYQILFSVGNFFAGLFVGILTRQKIIK